MMSTAKVKKMIVSNFNTMTCGSCYFNYGLCYTAMPPKYKCTFDNNFYDSHHNCHLDLAPVIHATWYEGSGRIDDINGDYDNAIIRPTYICSNCKCEEEVPSDYCPNCGAHMDLEV